VAKLIGIKVLVNEFVAFAELGKIIDLRKNLTESNTFDLYRNGTLSLGDKAMIWNDKSIVISTYALCGFANLASIGLQLGGLSALAPTRFKTFSKYVSKAMVGGILTSFMTASIIGLLYK
jgi:pyrimidine nucleoside transport protein